MTYKLYSLGGLLSCACAALVLFPLGSSGGARQENAWAAGEEPVAGLVAIEAERVAPDGVTHLVKATLLPAVTDGTGSKVRAVAMFSVFLHTSGDYVGIASTHRMLPASGAEPVTYAVGPFSGSSPAGEAWTGAGLKQASLAPAPGRTWGTVEGASDLRLTVSVVE